MKCPLCKDGRGEVVAFNRRREFVRCNECALVFVPEQYHLSRDKERERYALHNNSLDNSGYVTYLREVVDEVENLCEKGAAILDYGSGEHAVLTSLLREKGYRCIPFDPLYEFTESNYSLSGMFALVVVCEVMEHCRSVFDTVMDIKGRLAAGGAVCIRTQCYPADLSAIASWWYAQDPTHIAFFSIKTLTVVAALIEKKLVTTDKDDVFILK